MKATCPNNPNNDEFITVAHISQDWVVDSKGDFIRVAENPDEQTTHGPDKENTWTCAVCGAHAIVK